MAANSKMYLLSGTKNMVTFEAMSVTITYMADDFTK